MSGYAGFCSLGLGTTIPKAEAFRWRQNRHYNTCHEKTLGVAYRLTCISVCVCVTESKLLKYMVLDYESVFTVFKSSNGFEINICFFTYFCWKMNDSLDGV